VTWDAAAEAATITGTLRALAPEPTAVPMIKTSRPFYGARVGDRLWQAGVREEPGRRFGLLEAMAVDPHPFTRRLALVACTRLARTDGAAGLWPRVAGLLLALAADREAALPKASSWVLRSWLGTCPAEVAAFVDSHAGRLPALAVRETRAKLATGRKRPPRRPAPAGGRR
jgi:hypothetical protein